MVLQLRHRKAPTLADPPLPSDPEVVIREARRRQRRRWLGAVAAVTLLTGLGVGIGIGASGGGPPARTSAGGSPSSKGFAFGAPHGTRAAIGDAPTALEEARIESHLTIYPHSPGWRPSLEAELVDCDYRALGSPPLQPGPNGSTAPLRGAQTYVSSEPMTEPVSESMIVTACSSVSYMIRTAASDAALSGTPSQLCVTTPGNPEHEWAGVPVLVFGTSCQTAGDAAVAGEVGMINHRRALEAAIEAVPQACPTKRQAVAWVTSQLKRFQLVLPLWDPNAGTDLDGGCFHPLVNWYYPRNTAGHDLQPPGTGYVQLNSDG